MAKVYRLFPSWLPEKSNFSYLRGSNEGMSKFQWTLTCFRFQKFVDGWGDVRILNRKRFHYLTIECWIVSLLLFRSVFRKKAVVWDRL
jgi:hypothetical protein